MTAKHVSRTTTSASTSTEPSTEPSDVTKRAKKSATKAATKTAAGGMDAMDHIPEVSGSEAHYRRFLSDARAIPEAEVRPSRIEPSLAHHNVLSAVESLLAEQARIAKELPALVMDEVRTLPELSLALAFATSQVDRETGASGEIAKKLTRMYEVRDVILASAVSLSAVGVLPQSEVKRIQKGRGAIDAAQDGVDLVALFRKHASAVRGKTPITADMLKEAADLGTELLLALKPKKAKKDWTPKGALKEAIDVRDRMATLLVRRFDRARRAGIWLWGEADVDDRVPLLQARAGGKRKPKQEGTDTGGDAEKGDAAKAGGADK